MSENVRIQKYMSSAGICSRRKAEEYIERWLVTVNGHKASIWQSVCPGKDIVKLEDMAVKEQKNLVYYKINKPRWIITTCAEYGDKNVIDIIDVKERVFPIWRLDKDSTGLLLLTNDWRLTNYLIHPRYSHEKEYIVESYSALSDKDLDTMRKGIFILGSYTKEAIISRISKTKFSIILTEGKNRQIRRMVEHVWWRVKKLKRIRIENIHLWDLNPWEYTPLTSKEKQQLFKKLKLQSA